MPHNAPVRLTPYSPEIPATHALLLASFAYMDARIDPPSSLHRMTAQTLANDAETKEVWIIPGPKACVILTPETDHLYVGKLAVAASERGAGLARSLIAHAATRARALGLPRLQLQTRVELIENQKTFMGMGFIEAGRTAHQGYDRPTSITYALEL